MADLDSGFESLNTSESDRDSLISDEDAEQERKCTEEAKNLLARCVRRCVQLCEYRIDLLLGYGTFGIVVEATHLQSGQRVAIKIARKAQIHSSRMCTDPRTNQPTPLEVALLKYCPRHDNIIKYLSSWEDQECWYLVTELGGHAWSSNTRQPKYERLTLVTAASTFQHVLVPKHSNNHSLAGLLRASGGYSGRKMTHGPVMAETIQKHIFRQIADGLNALHQHGIAHKDIKDENVLVDSHLNVKIIDFGHAAFYRTASNPNIAPFKSYGTPLFAAPEIRSGLGYIGPECDIYALGLMLYEATTGDLPENLEAAVYSPEAQSPFDFGSFSPDAADLCRWMLCPDPMQRATIGDILAHPFLN
jgi:serine/threonine protein kinase